jgi:hypothetical protein
MPCDTKLKAGQTIQQRASEIRAMVSRLVNGLITGKVKPVIGPTGAVAFAGLPEAERDGVTDNCAYRRVMASDSVLAKQAIARAEQLSGRSINRQAVAHGHHSHDGGVTWHHHKG